MRATIPQVPLEDLRLEIASYLVCFVGGPDYHGLVGSCLVQGGIGRASGVDLLNGLHSAFRVFPECPGAVPEWDGRAWSCYVAPLPPPAVPPAVESPGVPPPKRRGARA